MNIRIIRFTILLAVVGSLFLLCLPGTVRAQFSFDECSNTEAWIPMGLMLSRFNEARQAVTWNNDLYIANTQTGTILLLRKWDGKEWADVSVAGVHTADTDSTSADPTFTGLAVFNNKLYLSGVFSRIGDVAGFNGLAEWDGVSWKQVSGSPLRTAETNVMHDYRDRAYASTVYGGELLISGSVDVNGTLRDGLAAWNGTTWRILASDSTTSRSDSLYITSFVEWRGDLYAGGYFNHIGGIRANGIARWNGTAWSALGNAEIPQIRKLFVYRDELYALNDVGAVIDGVPSNENLHRWDGNAWQAVPGVIPFSLSGKGHSQFGRFGLGVYGDRVYFIADRNLISFTGKDTARRRLSLSWGGGSDVRPLAHHDDYVSLMVNYGDNLIAAGGFGWSCNMFLGSVAQLSTNPDTIGISGRVMLSDEDDCVPDPGKPGLPGRIIQIFSPGSNYALTDSNGHYRRYVDIGSHVIRLVPGPHGVQVCPPSLSVDRTAFLEFYQEGSRENNFALKVSPHAADMAVSVAGGFVRPGREIIYTITCVNVGAVPVAGCVVTFEKNPIVTITGSDPSPDNIASLLSWRLPEMRVGDVSTIRVRGMVSTDAVPGMTVCAHAAVIVTDDAFIADNSDNACMHVTTSHDPNDISVMPVGTGDVGNITSRDSVLTYTVRFQNNGSDTARRVVVIDTLSPYLELTSFTLGASSHPFALHIGDHGELIWDFHDINLPDSAHNALWSQGYFKYSIRLRRGLPVNTRIENRAMIFFDYNSPMSTNIVRSTITMPASGVDEPISASALSIYPNPAHGVVYLRGTLKQGGTVEIANAAGEIVRSARYGGDGDMRIDLDGLAAGAYTVTAEMALGRGTGRITLVR